MGVETCLSLELERNDQVTVAAKHINELNDAFELFLLVHSVWYCVVTNYP